NLSPAKVDYLNQRGYTLTGERWIEPAANVELANFIVSHLIKRPRNVGDALQITVVQQHDCAIGGKLNVHLCVVGPARDGLPHGTECVLRGGASMTPVRGHLYQWAVRRIPGQVDPKSQRRQQEQRCAKPGNTPVPRRRRLLQAWTRLPTIRVQATKLFAAEEVNPSRYKTQADNEDKR